MVERILLLAGPPFGPALFRGVEARLRALAPGVRVEAAAVPFGQRAPFLPDLSGALVLAHGLAVPAALRANAAALIVSDGPISRLDLVTRALLSAGPAPPTLLRPGPWTAWLRSSAGLRRAVANPYAMDRDTVAALCGPPVASAEGRRRVAAYLHWLPSTLPVVVAACPAWAVWGDEDALYPTSEADIFDALHGGGRVAWLPGGRFAHPEELPWALADQVLARAQSVGLRGLPGGSTTVVSRSTTPGLRHAAGPDENTQE